MVGSTLQGFDAFLKDNYTDDEVARVVNEDHFFLDDLDTKKRGTGRRWIVPLIDGNPQGVAATVAGAQAAAEQTGTGGNITGAAWTITWGDISAHVDIGDKIIAASASDMGAFFEDMKEEIDGIHRQFADNVSSYMLRDQGHAVASTTAIATGVVTCTNPSDIVNIERGMLLQASANDGTSTAHSLLGAGSIGYVISVNYNTGSFTVSATSGGAAGTPASWTGTMFFFRNADFGGGATPNRILLGYGAWNPVTDPSATLFEGVDRSVQIIRRSGTRLTAAECSGLGVEQRLKKLVTRMSSRAKRPTKLLVHPEQWQAIGESLESRGIRNISKSDKVGVFSFESIALNTPAGQLPIYQDKFMPIDSAYAYDPRGIRFATLDGFPKVVNGDGLTMLRKSTENTYEYRLVAYPGYCHRDPSMTGRCPLLIPS